MDWHARVIEHMPLVSGIVNRMKGALPGHIRHDDLKSYGYEGLCKAAIYFHPDFGTSFRTYATHRIRWAIMDGLRDLDHIAHSARYKAKRAGLTHTLPEMTSLDDSGGSADHDWHNLLADSRPGPDIHAGMFELPGICKILSDREFAIVDMRYRGGHTFEAIGRVIGVSESRVCQLHQTLIERLRNYALEVGGEDDACEPGSGSRGGAKRDERNRSRACKAEAGDRRRRVQA